VHPPSLTLRSDPEYVFQKEKGKSGDRRRLQADLHKVVGVKNARNCPGILSAVDHAKERICQLFGPSLQCTGSVVLYSESDCKQQIIHIDGAYDDLTSLKARSSEDTMPPLGVLIAVERGTALRIWPGGHRLFSAEQPPYKPPNRGIVNPAINMAHVYVPPYNMLIFRQDIPHAGENYLNNNIRIHLYYDIGGYQRPTNSTGIVHSSWSEKGILRDSDKPTTEEDWMQICQTGAYREV